jgi:PAS domain S-box-containing protein
MADRDSGDSEPRVVDQIREGDLLRSLMDSVPDRIYFKDSASRFLRINQALADWFGLPDPQQAVGKTDADFFTALHAAEALLDEQQVMQSGQAIVGKEERESWADERASWVSTTKMPLRDSDGKIIGTFGVSRDITERKLAEMALRNSEERTRLIVDTARDAFVGMDSSGLITDWNRQAELTFGWSREEAIGQPLGDIIVPPQFRDAHSRGLAAFLENQQGPVLNTRIEITALDRQGREFPIELTITPIRLDGNWLFAAFIHDISGRRQAAVELQQAKEAAEAASRAKSDFLANMSHEIRTPMNAIIGMTELVLDSELPAEQREFLSMVKESADSLLVVLNDILDFSKIEAGRLDLDRISFHLRDSLGDMLHTLALRAEQRGLELACRIGTAVPDRLCGDPGRLRQILVNLIGNAIKFTEHGEIVIDVEPERSDNRDVWLHFRVRDTGVGIPPEKHSLIFHAFSQADSSTTRKYGGTGLGLTISAQLVALMGGRIWVESVVGEGSTFHFTARFELQADDELTHAAEPPDLHELPVLIVDDNATNRRILVEVMTNWHLRPTAVEGGEAALVALREARRAGATFSLVLLDAMMPGMDGFQLAERIIAEFDGATTTLMMLSSAAQGADSARCRQLGIAAYLTKPVKQSDLLDAIMTALARRPQNRAARPAAWSAEEAMAGSPPRRALRIVLAEDNLVNQKLAVRLLERWGHAVRVASNGRQVLAELETAPCDLVLMDVQMPELDGFETTAAIRERERTSGGHLPIIAMTAHAMKGDRELCLAAGMDGYISKPIQPRELFETLTSYGTGLASPSEKAEPVPTQRDAGIDRATLLGHCGGDEALLREIAEAFLESYPPLLAELQASAEAHDSKSLVRAAHTLKSSVGYFGVPTVRRQAAELEQTGRTLDGQADWGEVIERASALAEAIERLRQAIAALVPL